jgi:hypothetical protein
VPLIVPDALSHNYTSSKEAKKAAKWHAFLHSRATSLQSILLHYGARAISISFFEACSILRTSIQLPSLQHPYLLNPPSQRRISPKANHSPNIALLLSILSLLLSLLFSFHLSNLTSTAIYACIGSSLNFSQPFLTPFVSFVQPRCSQFFFCPPCVFSGCCSSRFPSSCW